MFYINNSGLIVAKNDSFMKPLHVVALPRSQLNIAMVSEYIKCGKRNNFLRFYLAHLKAH